MCATFNIDRETIKKYIPRNVEWTFKTGDVYPSDGAIMLTRKQVELGKWGFSKFENKGKLINARAETVLQKQTFAPSFSERRCVIPANGFYEWDAQKKKFYFVRADGAPLFLCGFFRPEHGENRFVILTKSATPPVDSYHDRIPVMATDYQLDEYLNDLPFARRFILEDAITPLNAIKR